MSKQNTSCIIVLIWFIFISNQQLFSKTLSFSNFPNQILYKVVKNNTVIENTQLRFSENQKMFLLTMSSVNWLNFSNKDKMVTYIHKKDLKLYSSFVVRGKKILQELRLKQVTGLLGDTFVYLFKDKYTEETDVHPSITEYATEYKYVDLLSSFIILSDKIYNVNYEMERFNFLIGKRMYVVISIIERKIPFIYKNKKINITKIMLKYNSESQKKKSVDLFEFYIYNDQKKDLWFPLSVTIFDADQTTCQLIADKYL